MLQKMVSLGKQLQSRLHSLVTQLHHLWFWCLGLSRSVIHWIKQQPRFQRYYANFQRLPEQTRKVLIVSMTALIVLSSLGSALLITDGIRALFAPHTQHAHQYDPTQASSTTTHLPPASSPSSNPNKHVPPMAHAPKPVVLGVAKLLATQPTVFTDAANRFEIDIPADAITAADVAAAGGTISLRVTLVAPPSGGVSGGSGEVSLGEYLVETVDAAGQTFAHGLRDTATLKLHYDKADSFTLQNAVAILNGVQPQGLVATGPYSSQTAQIDTTNQVLQASLPADPTVAIASAAATARSLTKHTGLSANSVPLATPNTTISWNSWVSVAKIGSPDPLSIDLTGGALTEGMNIDAPPGPSGAMPNITLSYNSGSVSEQHSPQGAAGWLGEGWNLGLGAITWSERQVMMNGYNTSNPSINPDWEDFWTLQDPFGSSTQILPPNQTVSTYYDDTANGYFCNQGVGSPTPCPVQWHAANNSHILIYSYVGPNSKSNGTTNIQLPCYRVYLPSGIMEEFGCTADSIQYYPVPNGGLPGGGIGNAGLYYPVAWYLDLITNPQGDQVHLTYTSQTATEPTKNLTYPRDVALSTITWDAPSCVNAAQACTGAAWNPQDRINFVTSLNPTRLTNTPANCNTTTIYNAAVRCDDPLLLSGTGNYSYYPAIQSVFTLDDIQVQTNKSGTWNTIHDYQLSYEQNGPTTITDTATGLHMSTAGYLDLTQVKEVGTDGTTAFPATVYGYTSQTEYYVDSTFRPYSTSFCGPSWNTGGNGNGCYLWSKSYDGNSRYLTTISNGQGLQQTTTWQLARNNTHGVPTGGTNSDPFYCDSHQTGYPCNSTDDQAWSRVVVQQLQGTVQQTTQQGQGGTQTTTPLANTSIYTYVLPTFATGQRECTDCVAGMYWGDRNEADYLDYYNGVFMGFTQTTISRSDGTMEVHKFPATEGWGVFNTATNANGITVVTCGSSNLNPVNTTCNMSPWSDLVNAAHGRELEADYYDTNGTTLLKKMVHTYADQCPPSGVTKTPSFTDTTQGPTGTTWYWGQLVSELEHPNPIMACDVTETQSVTSTYNGAASPVTDTEAYLYDSNGNVTQTTSTINGGGGSPSQTISIATYTTINTLTKPASSTANTSQESGWTGGTYMVEGLQTLAATQDASGNRYSCTYTTYLTSGNGVGNVSEKDSYTNCGTAANSYTPSGKITATTSYDSQGNQRSVKDPNANAGTTTSGISCNGVSNVTGCTTYDSSATNALPQSDVNAANQTSSATYGGNGTTNPGNSAGDPTLPTTTTDSNGTNSYSTYDSLGRTTSITLPGASAPNTTMAYTTWCSGTSAQNPCVENDVTVVQDSSDTLTSRTFYDGFGRQVETRKAGPSGQDIVQYTLYNANGQVAAQSVPYFVPAYTGGMGASAFSIPDASQRVATFTYDGLGRTLTTTDPISNTTSTHYNVVCSPVSGDTGCYQQVLSVDANGHQDGTLTDGFGRSIYSQAYTGVTGSYTLYSTTKTGYNYNGEVTAITYPGGAQATYTYDPAGHLTQSSDPDLGTYTYTYDANGNMLSIADPRGAAGKLYFGYDALNRKIFESPNANGSNALATWVYDGGSSNVAYTSVTCPTLSHPTTYTKGQLTCETFASNGVTGGYASAFDQHGNETEWVMSTQVGSNPATAYDFQMGFNPSNLLTSLTYPDGDVVTTNYNGLGQIGSVTEALGSTTNTLLNTISYNQYNKPTQAAVANNTYTWNLGYDGMSRMSDLNVVFTGHGTLYDQARTYDGSNNVLTINTTLPAGTDNQTFCYDALNRVSWAGSTGTAPSGCTSPTAGSLTAAQYQQGLAFDAEERLTTGPLGIGYTYGDPNHIHALTSAPSYSASYDAAGDMTARNGQALAYDAQRRLIAWQNTANNPTTTATYAYDGEGQRVYQGVTTSGSTTSTTYVGDYEEINTNGSTTTTTKYYDTGLASVVSVNGTLSYLVEDTLGSVNMALDGAGNVSATQLFAPYGGVRYSSGTMPTSKGFIGQRADPSGLDYFNARYYDPSAGLFVSADNAEGINRYGYVHGNPITHADPSGNCDWWDIGCHAKQVVQAVTNPNNLQAVGNWINNNVLQNPVVNTLTGGGDIVNDIKAFADPHKSIWDKIGAGVNMAFNVAMDVSYFVPGLDVGTLALRGVGKVATHVLGEAVTHGIADITAHVGEHLLGGASHILEGVSNRVFKGVSHFLGDVGDRAASLVGAVCGLHSFAGATLVATPSGSQAIDTLKVGDQVTAYDSKTGTTQSEPVLHVFINHDTNLLDVTLQPVSAANITIMTPQSGITHPTQSPQLPQETLHTTTEHPFLTADRGFVDAADLHLGEHVVRSDGRQGIVWSLQSVQGEATYYNLTVKDEHTFIVGTEGWVVHNADCGLVEYGSTALSKVVQTARKSLNDIGHNYAAALLENGDAIWARSGAKHAEERLLEKADELQQRIVELYSERQPCAAKCAGLLQSRGISNVSWSWSWTGESQATTKLVKAAARKLME